MALILKEVAGVPQFLAIVILFFGTVLIGIVESIGIKQRLLAASDQDSEPSSGPSLPLPERLPDQNQVDEIRSPSWNNSIQIEEDRDVGRQSSMCSTTIEVFGQVQNARKTYANPYEALLTTHETFRKQRARAIKFAFHKWKSYR